jgi:hypothetical protein
MAAFTPLKAAATFLPASRSTVTAPPSLWQGQALSAMPAWFSKKQQGDAFRDRRRNPL